MGKNIEVVYSLTFCVADRYNKEQDTAEKEKLKKELEELAKDYDYWKNAKFLFGGRKKEDCRQGYLRLVEEFRGLKEGKKAENEQTYTAPPKGELTGQKIEKPSDLEDKLKTEQAQQKDPWVLVIKYKGEKSETRIPVSDRETLIQQFRGIDPSIIDDKRMEYLDPDKQYRKVNDPNQLPKKAG